MPFKSLTLAVLTAAAVSARPMALNPLHTVATTTMTNMLESTATLRPSVIKDPFMPIPFPGGPVGPVSVLASKWSADVGPATRTSEASSKTHSPKVVSVPFRSGSYSPTSDNTLPISPRDTYDALLSARPGSSGEPGSFYEHCRRHHFPGGSQDLRWTSTCEAALAQLDYRQQHDAEHLAPPMPGSYQIDPHGQPSDDYERALYILWEDRSLLPVEPWERNRERMPIPLDDSYSPQRAHCLDKFIRDGWLYSVDECLSQSQPQLDSTAASGDVKVPPFGSDVGDSDGLPLEPKWPLVDPCKFLDCDDPSSDVSPDCFGFVCRGEGYALDQAFPGLVHENWDELNLDEPLT